MKALLIAIAVLSSSALSADDTLIDVSGIIGKSEAAVTKVIGQPTECTSTKHGRKCTYEKAETEIVFIKGKADWITIEGIDTLPFNKNTLSSIGIKAQIPSFTNDFTMRWEPLQGMRSISLFGVGSNADYFYIKAYTE
ncbi:hypothetical protein D3879_15730 [Pseudomonas cavernicola]|uniref:Uncharacterized protein n=1 Tax=Pseudomonas cavernicola TaxID=2320866 RepID=A0A418XF42_9PSED|nr:hypothetical protein [Pseudomonas cavernicola]RJG11109.1 hypothetical protein D3879_15730 [Pseudomonas cavernicola]